MAKAADEISHWQEYDYVLINRDLDKSFRDVLRAILAAERLKRERQIGLSNSSTALQAKLLADSAKVVTRLHATCRLGRNAAPA